MKRADGRVASLSTVRSMPPMDRERRKNPSVGATLKSTNHGHEDQRGLEKGCPRPITSPPPSATGDVAAHSWWNHCLSDP